MSEVATGPDLTRFNAMTVMEVNHELANAKEALDKLGAEKTIAQKYYDLLSLIVVPERYETEDIKSMVVDGIGRINLRGDMQVSVPKDSKDELHTWLKDHEFGDLIKPALAAQTLKAFIKEQISLGNEIPDELLKVHAYTRAVITKK